MYSPLWKITHQNQSVLCTPPCEKSPIKTHWFCVLPPVKNHPSKSIGFVYSPLWKITHQKPSVLCTPPFEKSPITAHRFCVLPPLKSHPSKLSGFVYSPLWKITHHSPSVLCTPPFEKSPIKIHRFHVLPPLKNHCFWWGFILYANGTVKSLRDKAQFVAEITRKLVMVFVLHVQKYIMYFQEVILPQWTTKYNYTMGGFHWSFFDVLHCDANGTGQLFFSQGRWGEQSFHHHRALYTGCFLKSHRLFHQSIRSSPSTYWAYVLRTGGRRITHDASVELFRAAKFVNVRLRQRRHTPYR